MRQRDRPTIVRGAGWHVWDDAGRRYLDATSSALNAVCGYGEPRIQAAAQAQAARLQHFELSRFAHQPASALAERLASLLGGPLTRTVLVNSGSEAVEAAVRIAVDLWPLRGETRIRVVTLERGYHGSTALCQSLSGLPHLANRYRDPVVVTRVTLPREGAALRTTEGLERTVEALERAIVGPHDAGPPAAVLLEPLLNVGGGIVLPPGLLARLRQICDRTGTLLVLDEVFTGFGRTGAWFAHQHDGARPDLIALSKGLNGGYAPIGAVVAAGHLAEEFAAEPVIGGLRYGHTTSGHAIACAAALAALDVIEKDDLVTRSARHGADLLDALRAAATGPLVTDVRGQGLIVSVEMADADLATQLVLAATARHVLLRQQGRTVMAVPPLTIDEAGIREIAGSVAGALTNVLTGSRS
ncbi:aspartate aminotransferase family protein [Micromonospora sp. C95]|uniref:aminotransferase family protein n=1 Tax=Micromonospora sp. C95 TaxID=2824882 RepID=UPI001B365FCE|nr:aminotransferase class III-fold pyridoxal phosphate-dependent enzyme [Micromonospora sp. C95]MBQ1026070.1 aspartate aminotransferase family protein [Micromonospora sp. C95]